MGKDVNVLELLGGLYLDLVKARKIIDEQNKAIETLRKQLQERISANGSDTNGLQQTDL